MKIIDQGLEKRIDHVAVLVCEDNEVSLAFSQFDTLYNKVEEDLGFNKDMHELEGIVNHLIHVAIAAAHRVGLADGMQLQQEVNAFLKGGAL